MKLRFTKRLAAFGIALATVITVMAGLTLFFAFNGQGYARVSFRKDYYFLVKDCEETTAAAVSGDIYSSGGAGYFLESDNAVAIACYFKETSAQSVQSSLAEKGTQTRLVVKSPSEMVLRGRKGAQKEKIVSNLETVDSLAHILYDTANGLERSELSQKEAKAALGGVLSSLKGLIGGNEGELYAAWNVALKEAQRRAEELEKGLLFSKDLRYLQTMLCDKAVNSALYFA